MEKSAIEVLDRLQSVGSEGELQKTIEWYLSKTDISTYAYIAFTPEDGPKGLNNHPQSWLDHYEDRGYLDVDPVISRARGEVLPFRWNDAPSAFNSREKTVMGEGREAGIVSGATIPVPGPGRSSGMFFISSHISNQRFQHLWQNLRHELHLVGLYAHSAFIEICNKDDSTPRRLTSREQECLLWTSRGKTAWEVSEVLKVSERTVVFHLQNAAKKLDCFSKHQAVVRAIMLGLINP
ncbi:MAG: LuxR family transcriptional regulator [Alphaproteobacteria bacterium]